MRSLLATVLGLMALTTTSLPVENSPNIVVLLTDDQAFDTLGCYGNPDVVTPHIDQLAADGVTFDRHYDTTAICMASRVNIMTGMYEYKTGCNFSHGDLLASDWKESYPVKLREAGYRSAFAGKFGFVVANAPGVRGRLPVEDFDAWGGGPGQTFYETAKNESMASYAEAFPHSTLSYAAFASDFIEESAEQGTPFVLSISFKAPHRPVSPDPMFDGVYSGKTFRKPENYGREHGAHFSLQSRQGRQYERFVSWGYEERFDEVMALYHQQIYAVDVAVGRIRAALERCGVAENTVLIFTSDNGFLCGAHGYGSKVLPYEESSRVPLIYMDPSLPDGKRGSRVGLLTGNIDLAPTILELAGVPGHPRIDGRSLLTTMRRALDGPPRPDTRSLALINVWGPKETHSLSVLFGPWKFIYWPYAGAGFEAKEELYHLESDPLELVNRADDPDFSDALERARTEYDRRWRHWLSEGVDRAGYPPFEVLFDRSESWERKAPLVRSYGG